MQWFIFLSHSLSLSLSLPPPRVLSFSQAIQALEKAMKLDSTFERAPLALSNIYASDGKPEKAVEVYVVFVYLLESLN